MPSTKTTTFLSGLATAACVWYAVNATPNISYLPSENIEATGACCLPQSDYQNPHYSYVQANAEFIDQIESINSFVSNLIENTHDLDPQITKLVDDNFWELG